MAKMKVLVTCPDLLGLDLLQDLSINFSATVAPCSASDSEMLALICTAEIYILGGSERVTTEMLSVAKHLKLIVFVGEQPETYLDPGVPEALAARSIPLLKTGGGATSVAKWVVAQIERFTCARAARSGRWADGHDLLRQTVGVVGGGRIGSMVMSSLIGRVNCVKCHEPFPVSGREVPGVQYVSADEVFNSDIVTLHLAWVPGKTDNIVTLERLLNINKSGMFINAARAPLVHPDTLEVFLQERPDVLTIWDVFYTEGKEFEKEPWRHEGIVSAPNFFLNCHSANMFYPEDTRREYREGLMRVLKEGGFIA